MPGRGQGKRGNAKYTQKQYDAAMEGLKTKSIRTVAGELNIPRSTLVDWKNNPNVVRGTGGKCVFDAEEEEYMCEALIYLAELGFPGNRDYLREVVRSYVIYSGKKTPFPDSKPGLRWVRAFEGRCSERLTIRKREGLSYVRGDALSPENINLFFERYTKILEKCQVSQRPWCIWNVDETGLQACRASTKVYVGRDVKHAFSIQPGGTKTMYTVLVCANAAGQFLPPYTLYKAANMGLSWSKGGPQGALYGVNQSGWMVEESFYGWFKESFVPQTAELCGPFRRVLVFDGHNSHITYPVVKLAIEENISIICLPPNTSHALQPLDVGVFKSMKVIWSQVVIDWFLKNPGVNIGKPEFPKVLKKVWDVLAPQSELPVAGFRNSGLYPVDKTKCQGRQVTNPNDTSTVGDNQGRPQGRRNKFRLMRESFIEHLGPRIPAPTDRSRKRVAARSGECLTEQSVAERLEQEWLEREAN